MPATAYKNKDLIQADSPWFHSFLNTENELPNGLFPSNNHMDGHMIFKGAIWIDVL